MKTFIKTPNFSADFNDELNGYVIKFSETGHRAQTQFDVIGDNLHADFGEKVLERYTEYDDELTEAESDMIDAFVSERNHSGEF